MTANKKGFTTRDMLRVDCLAYFAERMYKEKLKRENKIPFRPIERQIGKRKAIEALASNNEAPTVIKCRMAMLPEDFKVWAERIKENNPNNNIIVIPYDAEYVSDEERVEECE